MPRAIPTLAVGAGAGYDGSAPVQCRSAAARKVPQQVDQHQSQPSQCQTL